MYFSSFLSSAAAATFPGPWVALFWRSQIHLAPFAPGGSGDMAIPNLFWRNVEVVNTPPPLYLNFYHKLAIIAKPSVERVADT